MATATDPEVNGAADARSKPPFLRRVRIRGYKSIAFCDVALEPLTVLVGRNASGKSNFLDALGFLRDMISFNLPEAVRLHGGTRTVAHKGHENAKMIEFSMDLELPPRKKMQLPRSIQYCINIEIKGTEDVRIVSESLAEFLDGEWTPLAPSRADLFQVIDRALPAEQAPAYLERMYPSSKPLAAMQRTGWLEADLGSPLTAVGIYNFVPDELRMLQRSNPGGMLERSGRNLPDMLRRIHSQNPDAFHRISAYISVITDQILHVDAVSYGEFETTRFRMKTARQGGQLEFDAASMSDGTLRVLAALVAAFQVVPVRGSPSLVAIEEPETSLHPAAMHALVDALDEATLRTQILLTTHSAEMLDNPTIQPENIRVVQMIDGRTVIAPVDAASVEIVKRRLNTLGGLERDNLLEADPDDVERQQQLEAASAEPPK
ncbi:AAA family ATPase [Gemmata sp. JC717]|uniref:AAA family ATPase n=1 Tax=Gemmata algarum TaxID=2975278 RepID=UPI0021BA544D|nr:AAA family ATPase [Gemmata algarum]MDY3556109.1 AAA family ATPase [Gemmata algarum]